MYKSVYYIFKNKNGDKNMCIFQFQSLGATALYENKSVVLNSDVVIVSVKPDVVVKALKDVQNLPASNGKLFISVAMGVSTKTIENVS